MLVAISQQSNIAMAMGQKMAIFSTTLHGFPPQAGQIATLPSQSLVMTEFLNSFNSSADIHMLMRLVCFH